MERLWNALKGSKKDSNHELNRSTYSLVSCGEVTPDTLQLWVELPEEVKYDPELEKFRKMYEEIGNLELLSKNQKNGSEVRAKRLPLVYSAPLLDGKDHAWTKEKTTNAGTNNDGGTAIQNLELKDDVRVQPASGLQTKIKTAKYYSKMTLLLGCWVFFTAVFLMYNEKKEVYKNTAIPPGEVKNYTINASEIYSILVRISGPFLSEQAEIKMNSSEIETKERLTVWLEKWPMTDNSSTLIKKIILQDQDLDFNEGEPRALKFEFGRSTNDTVYAVHMRTTTNRTVAFSMSLVSDSLDVSTGVIYACVLLSGLYVLIIFEVINRTMAAIIVSTTSIAALALVGERPSLPELVSWLDVETLLLLFSMMLLVAIMAETGIFDYLAVFTFEVTRGKLWPLIFLLCTITAVLSTFLDNVTTVLLMSPVTIRYPQSDLNMAPRRRIMPHLSKDVHVVRERLERKVKKLTVQLDKMLRESSKRACPKDTFKSTLVDLKDKYKIRDKVLLIKASVAIAFVVTVFFLHSIPEFNRVSLSWTALIGATLLLILADREDLEPVLHRVEWSTLLFFAALFVLMEALSKLGLILYIGGLMEQLILKVDESARLAAALMLILWVSGMISAFVDNIPLTTMMVRVVVSIGSNPNLNLPMAPLIWALLFGACLGGNGTLIGASANVVCAGVAEQHGYRFTFMHFFRVGFPVMIGHLLVSSIYLLICHCVFAWH